MSSDNGKIKGTIGLKNFNTNFVQKINFNSNFQKKIDFKQDVLNKQTHVGNNFTQNNQQHGEDTQSRPVNQFRKADFSSFRQSAKEEHTNNNGITEQKYGFKKEASKEQFRKPNFNFQNFDSKYAKNSEIRNNSNETKQTFEQKKNYQNKFSSNKNGFSSNKSDFNANSKGKFNNFVNKKNTFFKKSNEVKIKFNNNKKNDNDRQVFKKTANTGGNFDKYSVNSMLKTMTNNIELDTEIDDVLGNVISVKLSGINSANSLQKERKIRMASENSKNRVKFNTPIVREIKIYNNQISIESLADQMAISTKELLKILQREGVAIDGGDFEKSIIDGDTAELIAESCGHKIKRLSDNDAENDFVSKAKESRTNKKIRPPIVTIMGHVDHGKTTLLDTIRKASVASGEAGGITQHIGAYRTKVGDKWITFLDTPGHAAFTQMRARGAKVTDIAVIVIAADDGIMPQTEEAISHAKTAGVPIIVAINKIDKPEANVEKAKQMLLQYEVVPEEFGGDTMIVPISAKEGKNIDKLLEAILLQAEMLELKASYDGTPEGFVVEAKMDKKRGALATVIVKEGTLQQGDFIIVGEQYGKIKGMFDENGNIVKTAEPSVPVEILGLNTVPDAGDIFYAVKNEKEVKDILAKRQEKAKLDLQNSKIGHSTADLLSQLKGEQEAKKISFIIKADTKGSLEAIVNTIEKFENNEVKLSIAHGAVGVVNESDVLLASTCGAFIMTFNTQKADKKVLDEAEKRGVEIRDYKIIYELFDDVKDILSGKLKPIIKKTIQGHAEVKTIFEISKVGKIAGCLVKDGTICRGANVAVMRNGGVVFETKCDSLKHGKENVKDIQSGQECGVGLEKIDEVQQGDILEFFTVKEEKNTF